MLIQRSLSQLTHEALGNAQLTYVNNTMVVSGMQSLEDGAATIYEPARRWRATLSWDPAVRAIRLSSRNNELPGDGVTSTLDMTRNADGSLTLSPTFVSPSHLTNVYEGTQLVGSLDASEVQMTIIDWDWSSRWAVVNEFDPDPHPVPVGTQQCAWTMALGTTVQVTDGVTTLEGDRVELIEDLHEVSYGFFTEIHVQGDADVTYENEQVLPAN